MWTLVLFSVSAGIYIALHTYNSRHPRLTPALLCVRCVQDELHRMRLRGDSRPTEAAANVQHATAVVAGQSLCSNHTGVTLVEEIWRDAPR